ncbi:copper transporter [Lyophyllum atratum]|nr:copper transporter [Lyophyllum atratum]
MDKWEPYFHWAFRDEPVLFSSLYVHSFSSFLAASILVICICIGERCLSRLLEKHWAFPSIRHSRWQQLVWRASLYWVVTLLRLSYMLISMTYNFGLIIVIVTSLTVTQTIVELLDSSGYRSKQARKRHEADSEQPLLDRQSELRLVTYPRSKSKPDNIFIHPNHSNLARADALASEMGISADTERVHVHKYEREDAAWNAGEGTDPARVPLGSSRKASDPELNFHVRDTSDSD